MNAPHAKFGFELRLTILCPVVGSLVAKYWPFCSSNKLLQFYKLRSYSPLLSILFICVTGCWCLRAAPRGTLDGRFLLRLARRVLLWRVNIGFACRKRSIPKVLSCDEGPILLLSWFFRNKIRFNDRIEPRLAILYTPAFGKDGPLPIVFRTHLHRCCDRRGISCKELSYAV